MKKLIYVSLALLLTVSIVWAAGKITDLTALDEAPAVGDLVEIIDVSDITMAATGTNKKITTANLLVGHLRKDDIVSQGDAEAGIATTSQAWTAQRVKQAIDALAAAAVVPSQVDVTTSAANETVYLLFVDAATGEVTVEAATGLTYNPSTGILTVPGGYVSGATATPGTTYNHSGMPGVDKLVAQTLAVWASGAEDVENAKYTLSVKRAGTMAAVLEYDADVNYLESTKWPPPTTFEITEASPAALTAAQTYNTILTNYGMDTSVAEHISTLPTLSIRTRFTIFIETATQDWELEPPTGEAITLDGVALAANQHLVLGDVVGDSVLVMRIRTAAAAYAWHVFTVVGTHAGKV